MKKIIGCTLAIAVLAVGAQRLNRRRPTFGLSSVEKQSLRDAPAAAPKGGAEADDEDKYMKRLLGEEYVYDAYTNSTGHCGYLPGEDPKWLPLASEIERLQKAEGYNGEPLCWLRANPKATYLIGVSKWMAVAEVTDSLSVSIIGRLKVGYILLPRHIYVSRKDFMEVSTAISGEKMKAVVEQGVPR